MPDKPATGARRVRVSQADVPRHPLGEALKVARCIEDHYGGSVTTPLDVATSIGSTPTSSWFRTITGAAIAYGLTSGGPNSAHIGLTSLGRRAAAPTDESDERAATVEALLKPRIVREFLQKYDQKKLPPDHIAQNVLTQLGVDREASERTLAVIRDSALFAGVLRSHKDNEYVDLHGQHQTTGVGPAQQPDEADAVEPEWETGEPAGPIRRSAPAQPRPIFIGHGRNHGPLKKLQAILDNFAIPYKVVLDEPDLGRPIPVKVQNVLRECGSAILVFTKDEQFFDGEGNEFWRPSENVVYELGAASYQYDERVVVLKEKGIRFPLDFEGIGSIEFEQDGLESKGIEIIKELIGVGLVRITPAG
jgi:hypothetical protein